MVRTRAGRGSREDRQASNQTPQQVNAMPDINEGNSENSSNPQPVTLEAIQNLFNSMRNVVQEDVNRILDNRLGENNPPSAYNPAETRPTGRNPRTQDSSHNSDSGYESDGKKGCSFKSFIACKPLEYRGSYEPKITMGWIRETYLLLLRSNGTVATSLLVVLRWPPSLLMHTIRVSSFYHDRGSSLPQRRATTHQSILFLFVLSLPLSSFLPSSLSSFMRECREDHISVGVVVVKG